MDPQSIARVLEESGGAPTTFLAAGFDSHLIRSPLLSTLATFGGHASMVPVHQYITGLAVESVEAQLKEDLFVRWANMLIASPALRRQVPGWRLRCRRLVVGVIWPDIVVPEVLDQENWVPYPAVQLTEPDQRAAYTLGGYSKAPYARRDITIPERFAWVADESTTRTAVMIFAMGRLHGEDSDVARSLQYRTHNDPALKHWHCMAGERVPGLTVGEVARRCTEYAADQVARAVVTGDLIFLGRALHVVQDSYAEGHTMRVGEKNTTLREIFASASALQLDVHARFDSMDLWEANVHRTECIAACANVLLLFDSIVQTLKGGADMVKRTEAGERARAEVRLLKLFDVLPEDVDAPAGVEIV